MRHLTFSLLFTLTGASIAAPVTFTKVYADGAELLQWTEQGGQLSGSYQLVFLTGTPARLESRNETFTGTRTGSTVSLKFASLLTTRLWSGTLNGANLTLLRPQQVGLSSTVFTKSSPEAYNGVVARLKLQAAQAQQDAQRAAQSQAAQQARVDAHTQAVRDVNRQASDAITHAERLTEQLSADQAALLEAAHLFQAALDTLREHQQTLLANARQAADCYAVRQVQGYELKQLTGFDLKQLTGYATRELDRALKDVQTHQQAVGETQLQLTSARQARARVPALTPLSTQAFTVNFAALDQASVNLRRKDEQLSEVKAQVLATQQRTLSQAQALILEAQQVAAGLTCAP